MKTALHDPVLLQEQMVSMPEIYYDEPVYRGRSEKTLEEFSASPARILAAFEKLLNMLHNRRDWQIVRMRANGLSYPLIARQLGIGVATIVRLMRKIEMHNPELGYLLAHAEVLHKQEQR